MDAIMVYIWLGIVVLALVGEALSLDMTSIWFAVGGTCSIIAWFIWNTGTGSIILQVMLFVFVSLICILTLRKLCKKLLLKKDTVKTNVDAYTGIKTKLLSGILYEKKGTIKINDVVWNCISEEDIIEEGTMVEILCVKGNKMLVKSVKEEATSTYVEIKEETPKKVKKEKLTAENIDDEFEDGMKKKSSKKHTVKPDLN